MSVLTPTSLPHTPSCSTMAAAFPQTLPRLPIELLSWSTWRQPRQEPWTPVPSLPEPRAPYTQPRTTVLPPIAQLERTLARPLTPPPDEEYDSWRSSQASATRLPAIKTTLSRDSGLSSNYADYVHGKPATPPPPPAPHRIDWFGAKHSSQFLAEKTCEMICYLWFSSSLASSSNASRHASEDEMPTTVPLQLSPSHSFVQFMQKVLETTQVSESVIVLALHYIYRLKERNRLAKGQAGSEFRVSVAALMLANKFVDDNTYTNKTWSEVSGIELHDITKMEREFLRGLDFQLYVDKAMYDSWLKLLMGLVMTKERKLREWQHHHRAARISRERPGHPPRAMPSTHGSSSSRYGLSPNRASSYARARSSSPLRTYRHASYHAPAPEPAPLAAPVPVRSIPDPLHLAAAANVGSKRSAADAFSPTSVSFPEVRPPKRPTGMTLEIPRTAVATPSSTASTSPLEPLQSFARLSLGAGHEPQLPHTLVAAYRVDPSKPTSVPQNLYYYSLACSPTEDSSDVPVEHDRATARKARLRYHQPQPSAEAYAPAPAYPVYAPQVIQSAQTSPRDVRISSAYAEPRALPTFGDASWTRLQPYTVGAGAGSGHHATGHGLAAHPTHGHGHGYTQATQSPLASIPSAPFANAGPPGVHFYPSPSEPRDQLHWSSPHGYSATTEWSRGRRM